AAYGTGDRGFGRRAAEDDIVRIVPAFRAFIPGKTLLIVRNVAVRLPSTEARQPSSVMSSRGPGGVKLPPAFATRLSIAPGCRPSRIDAGPRGDDQAPHQLDHHDHMDDDIGDRPRANADGDREQSHEGADQSEPLDRQRDSANRTGTDPSR